MIFIDSNVFVIDLRYREDSLFETNQRFLTVIRERRDGATTLLNLLEIAGILSFNLSHRQLSELLVHFPLRYRVRLVPELGSTAQLRRFEVDRLLEIISRKCALGDALIIAELEHIAPSASELVTWDAKHFAGKVKMPVLTPEQFLLRENP